MRCDNFIFSWRDGRFFNVIIYRYKYVVGGKGIVGGAFLEYFGWRFLISWGGKGVEG